MKSELSELLQKPLMLNAKTGEKILILTDSAMDPVVWKGLQKAAVDLGMEPTVAVMTPRATHSTNPPEPICAAALHQETDLTIYLTSTAMAHSRLTDSLIDEGKRFLLMEQLTAAMLAPEGPAGADYHALNRLGLRIADVYSGGETIRVTCPNGTDLTASIKGRPGRSIAGLPLVMKPGGGIGCAFPDGESHVCPVEGTGNGTVVFDLTAHDVGRIRTPIRLTVKDGMVVDIEGAEEAEIWKATLARFPDMNNYNCPAEISIGLNPRVTPTGSMRTDKKMYATSHIGMGDTIALGGTCHARLRLEGVISKPEISVDGFVIASGGRILLDDEGVAGS
jgi:leucyl aminopeptidase (aminopeptidase T)